jgi:hypothetical protein
MTNPTTDPNADNGDALTFGTPVTPGTYPATCVSVEAVTLDTADGPRDLLRWTFLVAVSDDAPEAEVDALSSRNTSPRSKPYAWVSALLGGAPEPGQRVRLADLAGRRCLVSIENDENGYPKVAGLVAPPRGKGQG